MSFNAAHSTESHIASQPDDARFLDRSERDSLIISAVRIDREWIITSRYGDDVWKLTGGTSNKGQSRRQLNFLKVPASFRAVAKELFYRYQRRGREGQKRPSCGTMTATFNEVTYFLSYLDSISIKSLCSVTPLACMNYVAKSRAVRQRAKKGAPPLSPTTLQGRFSSVELLYELSQYTSTPMPLHPWRETSSWELSGTTKVYGSQTPVMPDDVFTSLFSEAWAVVEGADSLLDLRDLLAKSSLDWQGNCLSTRNKYKRQLLTSHGWKGNLREFTASLSEIQTACYIIVASLSGCRHHELAYVCSGSVYSTEEEGETYWWMKSQSRKTGAGHTEWMIPPAAVKAIRTMERVAAPHQAEIAEAIAQFRLLNPVDQRIAEAEVHMNALFLTASTERGSEARTQSNESMISALQLFCKKHGVHWDIATHHFRRKFANYAARSKFGDLRYLREHFKHWSQDMTNDSYALNESLEMELYAEVQNEHDAIKRELAGQWLEPAESLAGGYGKDLIAWRSRGENIALFKNRAAMVKSVAESHAIRSNGHAWCTADNSMCVGNSIEKTRCSGCSNAVIGRFHLPLYLRAYEDSKELCELEDIGIGGRARAQRDMERCREVLISLGFDPEASST